MNLSIGRFENFKSEEIGAKGANLKDLIFDPEIDATR